MMEGKSEPHNSRRWRVLMEASATVWTTVVVEAATEDEAQSKALNGMRREIEWDVDQEDVEHSQRRVVTVEELA